MFRNLVLIAVLGLFGLAANAQTTEFTYQGSLKDGANPANGNYDFEFVLFDALSGGTQVGAVLTRNTVPVAAGTFSVKLDFGSQFPGASRFLEIHVRRSGAGGFTPLIPRQLINSSPYSVKSLSTDTALNATNAANATNATTATTANNALSLGGVAASQFVLTGDARLSDARNPLPGSANYLQNRTSQQSSTNFNISGDGTAAGSLSADIVRATTHYTLGGQRILTTAGTNNLFVGSGIGLSNTGTGNSFFGQGAGNANLAGSFNTFIGRWAGFGNLAADSNTLVGFGAGKTSLGSSNTFFGYQAGNANTTGSSNTLLGANADVSPGNLTHATAIGADAVVFDSNTIVLGRSNHQDTVKISGDVFIYGGQTQTDTIRATGVYLQQLGGGGNVNLCLNSMTEISTCSSSLRYKTNFAPYRNGLDVLDRLRPITFDWKEGGKHDLGFGAEDVQKVDPLLVTYNSNGQVEGVKYDRVSLVLVNAVMQQQKIIEDQQHQINELRKLVCLTNTHAEMCKGGAK